MLLLIALAVALLFILILGAGLFVLLAARRRSAPAAQPLEPPTPADLSPALGEAASSYATTGLFVTGGPLAARRFSVPVQGLTIGRFPDNDVVLDDQAMVSRHHATLAVENGEVVLYDRDSANGTWVNGARVFRHVLAPGDRIQIGLSEFCFAGASLAAAPPPPPPPAVEHRTLHDIGEYLDGYLLEGLIGSGGMSEVYRARDPDGQVVAIKVLQQADPYVVAKFVQEGNDIGPVLRQHAGIVYVHKFGKSADGRLYIVMEYVDAPSLRKLLRGPLPEAEAVRIARQICDALAFAHQHQIVHRDIKPENVLVSPQAVKILDFGIAKLTSASTVTRDKIVGTPEYLSPEQARGDPVQPASDVYSLGIVLYEMLTGTVPFPLVPADTSFQSTLDVITRHLTERPEKMQKRNPAVKVSAQVERVVTRALEKEPAHRYPAAGEMGRALGGRQGSAPAEPPAAIRPAEGALVILDGPRKGQRIPLAGVPVSLGRAELAPADATVSRQHASLFFQGGRYWLRDTSRNGTWVDEERVYGEVPLQPGAVITIGATRSKLEMAES